jgi:hypothetical protein
MSQRDGRSCTRPRHGTWPEFCRKLGGERLLICTKISFRRVGNAIPRPTRRCCLVPTTAPQLPAGGAGRILPRPLPAAIELVHRTEPRLAFRLPAHLWARRSRRCGSYRGPTSLSSQQRALRLENELRVISPTPGPGDRDRRFGVRAVQRRHGGSGSERFDQDCRPLSFL